MQIREINLETKTSILLRSFDNRAFAINKVASNDTVRTFEPFIDDKNNVLIVSTDLLRSNPEYAGNVIALLRDAQIMMAHNVANNRGKEGVPPPADAAYKGLKFKNVVFLPSYRKDNPFIVQPPPSDSPQRVRIGDALRYRVTSSELTYDIPNAIIKTLELLPNSDIRNDKWLDKYIYGLRTGSNRLIKAYRDRNPQDEVKMAEQIRAIALDYAQNAVSKIENVLQELDKPKDQREINLPDNLFDWFTSSWSNLAVPGGILLMLFGGNPGLLIGTMALFAGGASVYNRYKNLISDWRTQIALREFIKHGADIDALQHIRNAYGSQYEQACRDFLMAMKVGIARNSVLNAVEQEVLDRAALLLADTNVPLVSIELGMPTPAAKMK